MSEITYEYLDDRDKNNIVINHIRSVEYNLYNLEIQQTLANVATNKDQQLLAQLQQESALQTIQVITPLPTPQLPRIHQAPVL